MDDFVFKKILLIESSNNSNKIRKHYYNNGFQDALKEFNTKYRMDVSISSQDYDKMFIQLIKDEWLIKGCCPSIWKIKT